MKSRNIILFATLIVALGSGCRALVEVFETDPGTNADGGPGKDGSVATIDAGCGEWSHKPTPFDPCSVAAPNGDLVLGDGDWSYDTNSGALTDPDFDATFPPSVLLPQPDGPQIRVVSVNKFTLENGANLRVVGARPLVIAAWDDVQISGYIDVGSHDNNNDPGAGASPDSACANGEGVDGESDSEGSAGGGGGAFAGNGGMGGNGHGGEAIAGTPGAKVPAPMAVRGGCAGGDGGETSGSTPDGGDGGGAIYISSQTSIRIDGKINAGGSGGEGGEGNRQGGGGGGSGGYIGLEAPQVRIDSGGLLGANGGGGGGGCDNNDARSGDDGALEPFGASGGDKEGMGTSGGRGGAGTSADGQAASPAARGGGGGGGGVGYIILRADSRNVSFQSLVTPPFTQVDW